MNLNITTYDELLEKKYGPIGSPKRNAHEDGYEAFRIGVLIHQERIDQGLSIDEVSLKCGFSKSYISRIENDAGEYRLNAIMTIIRDGLGGRLKLNLEAKKDKHTRPSNRK